VCVQPGPLNISTLKLESLVVRTLANNIIQRAGGTTNGQKMETDPVLCVHMVCGGDGVVVVHVVVKKWWCSSVVLYHYDLRFTGCDT